MKKTLLTLVAALICSIVPIAAQPQGGRQKGDMQKFQISLIIKQLEITEDKQDSFTELYTQYTTEIKKLRPKHERGEGKPTDEMIEQQILDSFEMTEKSTALKKEYYPRFRELLTPEQILRMYSIERQMHDRLNSEIHKRNGGQGGGERPHGM